jgi:hypothetical protein
VTHRESERIGTVTGSVAFSSVGDFAVNPGLASSFPWLSGIAQHYERYRIDSLIVRYKNLKGTDSDGNIIMSFDYDTLDPGPATAVEQTQSTVFIDGAPWRIFEMRVPSDGTRKYIRTSEIAGADLKTYDFGRIWVSAEGCADTSAHGYLELEYVVSLFEKQTGAANSPANRVYSQWNLASSTSALSASAVLDISEDVVTASSNAPSNTSGVVTLSAAGYYLVTAEYSTLASVASDTNSTIEIRVDSASQSPPCLSYPGGLGTDSLRAAGSLSCLVLSDGTTTVDVYYNDGAANHTFFGDGCRLSVCAL